MPRRGSSARCRRTPAYVPALIGRGQALLELDRDADALASFEAALAKDPSLTDLRSRVDVLRFRATQDMLARAKAAADARRWDEATAIYQQAIAASPDSAFLYRDLAAVEQQAGQSAECARALPQGRATRSRRCAIAGRRSARSSRARATCSARWPRTSGRRAIDPAEVPGAAHRAPARRRRAGQAAGRVSRHSGRRRGDARRHRGAGRRPARAACSRARGRGR